jgi:hypothetical protein
MSERVSASLVVIMLSFGLAASASAQLVPKVTPLFDAPAPSPFNSRTTSLFDAGQIVDRPTSDLRPRFYWGILGSVTPSWSIPGSMGTLFFENPVSGSPPKMNGRDLRIGFVRARQVGFEMGASFVRRTVSRFTLVQEQETVLDTKQRITFTELDPVHMTGVDAHLVIPIARLGERAQLGFLGGGGIFWIPDVPIQKRIDGPPFYADATTSVPLTQPPASGGFVGGFFEPVPLVPGTTYGITTGSSYEFSATDYTWPLIRAQLAADFLVARPLKLRVAAGFTHPGVQAIGVEGVYLFRTAARSSPSKLAGAPPAAATPVVGQIADRPDVLAPRRSYWGVFGGVTPTWFTPHRWGEFFQDLVGDSSVAMDGRDFRIGITRGRPLGYEFGFSYVQKSLTRFSFLREGVPYSFSTPTAPVPEGARITLTQIDTVRMPGADFHAFIPIDRIGSRVQLGALLGIGLVHVPDTPIRKHIEGPPFFSSSSSFEGLLSLPADGGFVIDDNSQAWPVPPGQSGVDVPANAPEISPLNTNFLSARAQIAADVLVARPFKLRVSAGFNYPGMQLFGIEAIYLFGTGQ